MAKCGHSGTIADISGHFRGDYGHLGAFYNIGNICGHVKCLNVKNQIRNVIEITNFKFAKFTLLPVIF